MDVFYKPPFRKFVKKQSRAFQLIIEDEIEYIRKNPNVGEVKKGDISGFRVYKFIFKSQLYLIAYLSKRNKLVFYMVGSHENFYRRLKKYLR